jgi:hypothetical protein
VCVVAHPRVNLMIDNQFLGQFYKNFLFVMDVVSPELSPSELQIYLKMIRKSWANNQDYVRMSLLEFQKETGLSINTIKVAIRNLTSKNIIKLVSKPTSKASSSYKVFWASELKYYNRLFEEAGDKLTIQSLASPSIPALITESSLEEKERFIFYRLSPSDKEDFMVILGSIRPDKIQNYREMAIERLNTNGLEINEENVIGQRNDLILNEMFGAMRIEKYRTHHF